MKVQPLCTTIILVLLLSPLFFVQFASSKTPNHPNIIFILTDDLDATLGSLNYMPQVNSLLARQGVTFSNFFVTFSLCCPSRSSILRGQYPHNTQVVGNSPPLGGFLKFHQLGLENSTVATWLHAVGYRTVLLGKYLNGYPARNEPTYLPPGWDEWYSPAGDRAYSEFNYQLNENGKIVSYGQLPQDYLTDVLSGKTIDFIQRTASSGKPFFIYLATYAPHQPATPAPRHEKLFLDLTAPRPPSFNETDVSDKPQAISKLRPLNQKDLAVIDDLYRKRLQSLQAVDEMIQNIINTLRSTGQLDNTYIFFSSDNGFHLGEHRMLAGKNTAYEDDIRVPLIVRGPGVPAGKVVEHLTLNIDLALTFAEFGGASVAGFVDGRSLVPLLASNPLPASQWRQGFLAERWKVSGVTLVPDFQALRTTSYKYVEWNDGSRELYDLRSDPYELQNVYSSATPSLIAQLSSWLHALSQCGGASCRTADYPPSATGATTTSTATTQTVSPTIPTFSPVPIIIGILVVLSVVGILLARKRSLKKKSV